MTKWKSLGATTAMLLVLSGAAQADVTGQEVWDNWKSVSKGMGQVLTPGSETQNGDTLTVKDVKVTMDAPDMTMTGTIDMLEFVDQGDGTVVINVSPSYEMQMSMAPEEGQKINLTVLIGQPDMALTASGGDGTVTYEFSGPEITVSVPSLTRNGEPLEMSVNLVASDVTGSYKMTEGEMADLSSTLTAAMLTVDVDAKEPGGDGSFTLDAEMADLSVTSDGNLGMMGGLEDMPALLAAGFATSGEFSHGAANYSINFQDGADTFQMAAKAAGGLLGLSLDAEAISYEASNTGLDITVSGSDIPLPEVAASFAEFGMSFLMPLSQSDEPQDFGANLTLDGLQVSDMIWGLADPSGALPHDPATLIVDVSGRANWLIDIMNSDAMMEMEDQMPAELHALDLNDLRLAVAGALLSGTGSFTFDNSDLETFDGIPAPTGGIDLKLVGGNGLIDRLVAMGLVPEEQAMGARMMMGMFARPGDGEDTLTSKIEVKGDGSISANGQRLQ